MIDMHCHILPGIDDGAPDWETALEMARIAYKHGTTAIVATPHVIEGDWLPSWDEIVSQCGKLQVAVREETLDLSIYPGAEVALNMDLLDRLTGPGLYCINNGPYMLVELPAMEIPNFAEDFFFRLQSRGIRPILAHPERNPKIVESPQILLEWMHRGLLIQMNAPSLLGRMGERTAATAKKFLANGMVHLIGSDAHGVKSRRPKLDGAVAQIQELIGDPNATILFQANPELILRGENLAPPIVSKIGGKSVLASESRGIKGWLAGLLKK